MRCQVPMLLCMKYSHSNFVNIPTPASLSYWCRYFHFPIHTTNRPFPLPHTDPQSSRPTSLYRPSIVHSHFPIQTLNRPFPLPHTDPQSSIPTSLYRPSIVHSHFPIQTLNRPFQLPYTDPHSSIPTSLYRSVPLINISTRIVFKYKIPAPTSRNPTSIQYLHLWSSRTNHNYSFCLHMITEHLALWSTKSLTLPDIVLCIRLRPRDPMTMKLADSWLATLITTSPGLPLSVRIIPGSW